jgi:CPA1 family monovalent cation:H+ antiporter
MTVARTLPERQSPRERVHLYSVWEATVFLLNVLAFLLMGLQARAIITRLDPGQIGQALGFAGLVLGIVVAVRVAWVLAYNRLVSFVFRVRGRPDRPSLAQGLVVAWCGMRGLVTLATALALPETFPARDLIVLSALAVVLGTLVGQGLTLGPLIRLLRFMPDDEFDRQLSSTRVALLDAAIASLGERTGEPAARLRDAYHLERAVAAAGRHPRAVTESDHLRRHSLIAKRGKLAELRRSGQIDDDVFHVIEQELDWAELAAWPPDQFELEEGYYTSPELATRCLVGAT